MIVVVGCMHVNLVALNAQCTMHKTFLHVFNC